MKERDLELKVGLMILGALAVLGVFLYVLGDFAVGPGYKLYVDFNFSGNLQPGAPVRVAGIKVGQVESVALLGGELDPVTGRRAQVRFTIWVEKRVTDTIRSNAEFFVNTTGVLGEKYLEIVPGSHEQPALPPGSYVVGVDPPRTDLIIARAYELMDVLTTGMRDNKEALRDLVKNASLAIADVTRVLGENRESIGRLLVSADGFASESSALLADVRKGLGDPTLIRRIVSDADTAIVHADQALTELVPKVSQLLDESVRLAGLVTEERVVTVVDATGAVKRILYSGNAVMDEVLGLINDVRQGKGTVGRILTKEELYADIREMVRDLKQNPWKLIWKE